MTYSTWAPHAVALVILASAPNPSLAQSAIQASRYYKVVEHGHSVEIDHLGSLDPDCRSRGLTTVNLLVAPSGGEVSTRRESRFPSFVKANVRSQCDARRTPSTVIYYKARPDFAGNDVFDVEIIFPEGVARKIRYAVAVR